jgi:hypothetical protein
MELSPYLFDDFPTTFDLVLFDGGEFTTYYEFIKLYPRCSRFIALDDADVAKCLKIRKLLQNDSQWKEICYFPERNGFSLFERR